MGRAPEGWCALGGGTSREMMARLVVGPGGAGWDSWGTGALGRVGGGDVGMAVGVCAGVPE